MAGTCPPGSPGENILLGTRSGSDHFYVFWIHYRDKALHLAYYDQGRDRSRVLPLAGFRFFALPEIIEENGVLRGLVFLGNRDGNDDIFHYDLETRQLTALTRTPFSEKGFTMKAAGAAFEIETRSLWKTFRYRFDPRQPGCELLEERAVARPRRRAAAATIDPSRYYNTYHRLRRQHHPRARWDGRSGPNCATWPRWARSCPASMARPGRSTWASAAPRPTRRPSASTPTWTSNPAFYFLLMLRGQRRHAGSTSPWTVRWRAWST